MKLNIWVIVTMVIINFYWIGDVICEDNLLRYCSNKFTSTTPINDWLKLGQFTSYCMQYDSAVNGVQSTLDVKCESDQCRQCMKVCSKPHPFELQQCFNECKESTSCKNGCSFYSQLFVSKNSGETQDLELSNKPAVKIDKRQTSIVSTSWPEITSQGNIPLSSVYLLTLEVKTRYFNKFTVIGLTAGNRYNVTLSNICAAFGYYKFYDPTEAKLNVYPINFNGWNDNAKLSSTYFTFKKISPVQNIKIKTPPIFVPKFITMGINAVKWKVTWDAPKDLDSLNSIYNMVKIKTDVKSCKDFGNFRKMVMIGTVSEKRVPLNGPAEITMPNTDDDNLRGCTVVVKITTLQGDCLVGQEATQTVLYKGCETLIGGKCPVAPTPKPTDGPITGRRLSILNHNCLSCGNNKCTNGTYTVKVEWSKPVTSSPVQEYQLTLGKAETFGLGPFSFEWVNPRGKFTKMARISPHETSFTLAGVPYDIKRFGVMFHAHTATSGAPRPLLKSKYTFLDVPELSC